MALATITARVEDYNKEAFDEFCTSVGLTVSAALNLYICAVVRERRIPFEIRQEDPFYSRSNQEQLKKSIAQIREGKSSVHNLIEDEDE